MCIGPLRGPIWCSQMRVTHVRAGRNCSRRGEAGSEPLGERSKLRGVLLLVWSGVWRGVAEPSIARTAFE